MAESSNSESRPGGERVPWALTAVIATGVLLGSVWAARGSGFFSPSALTALNRVASVAFLVVFAVGWQALRLDRRRLLGGAAIGYGLHLACVALALVIPDQASVLALQVASGVFEGFTLAALELLFMQACAALSPTAGAVAVAGAFACATLYDTVAVSFSPTACFVQWLVGGLLALVAMAWVSGRAGRREREGTGGGHDQAKAGAQVPEGLRFAPWFLPFMAYCVVVLLSWGVLSSAIGFGAAGGNAYFGMSAGIAMFVVRVAVVGVCALGASLGPAPVVGVTLVLWVASLWVTVLPSASGGVAADLLREAVYYSLQVFPLALPLIRAEGEKPGPGVLCVALAVSSSNHVTRFVCPLLGMPEGPEVVDVCAALACGLAVAVGVWAIGRLAAGRPTAEKAEAPGPGVWSDDPAWAYEAEFCRRFQAVCDEVGFTDRERAVLLRAVHGYTIDNIAAGLSVSRETVKTELARAYARAGANGKQAILARMDALA